MGNPVSWDKIPHYKVRRGSASAHENKGPVGYKNSRARLHTRAEGVKAAATHPGGIHKWIWILYAPRSWINHDRSSTQDGANDVSIQS